MARSSPYRIVLDTEQERELRRRAAAYSGPWRDVVRARAMLLAAEGLSNAAIAERLGASRQSVSEWRKRFFEQGVAGLEERPRTGVGWPGASQPPAPMDPGVTVSRHRAPTVEPVGIAPCFQ